MEKSNLYKYFFIEAREIIEQLSNDFLTLEKSPGDTDVVNNLFRHAHTLKGSSRMVGLDNIGEISHHIETMLGELMEKKEEITSSQIDSSLKAIDMVDRIVSSLEAGSDLQIDIEEIINDLFGKTSTQTSGTSVDEPSETLEEQTLLEDDEGDKENPPDEEHFTESPGNDTVANDRVAKEHPSDSIPPQSENLPDVTGRPDEDSQSHPNGQSPAQDTIRVSLHRLNTILDLCGEMTINRIRLQDKIHKLKEIKALATRLEEVVFHDNPSTEITTIVPPADESRHMNDYIDLHTRVKESLSSFIDQYEEDIRLTHLINLSLQNEAFKALMLPAETLFNPFNRMVRDLARELGKEIDLKIIGDHITVDKYILDELKAPLMHLVRNSCDHGIEAPDERLKNNKERAGSITIKLDQEGSNLVIVYEDDGRGIDRGKVLSKAIDQKIITKDQAREINEEEIDYFIMKPGFSTESIVTNISGRGVGMDVVADKVAKLRGNIKIESEPYKYTRFIINIPQSLGSLLFLLFRSGRERLLLPLSSISKVLKISPLDIKMEGTREVIDISGETIPLVRMSKVLDIEEKEIPSDTINVIVVHAMNNSVSFTVNQLLGIHEVVVKSLGNHIKKVKNIGGATILGDGTPIVILNPHELVENSKYIEHSEIAKFQEKEAEKQTILIVDDSLTTRMMEKSILESAGYEVDIAVNGEEALQHSKMKNYELIISDLEMPGMDGFELIETLKSGDRYMDTPMIIVSSKGSPEIKRKGIEVGAQAYIVKSEFDQKVLLETVRDLI